MVALHNSPITAHGNLKSSKCLIDGRWVCKISDHGLESVKANQTEEDLGEYAENRSKSFIVMPNIALNGPKGCYDFEFLFPLARRTIEDNQEYHIKISRLEKRKSGHIVLISFARKRKNCQMFWQTWPAFVESSVNNIHVSVIDRLKGAQSRYF